MKDGGKGQDLDRQYLQEAAKVIESKLPDNYQFILLAAPIAGSVPEEVHRLVYVSSFRREDAIAVLKEWLIRANASDGWVQHIK